MHTSETARNTSVNRTPLKRQFTQNEISHPHVVHLTFFGWMTVTIYFYSMGGGGRQLNWMLTEGVYIMCFTEEQNKFIQVYNNMRVSKWWQKCNVGVNCPFKWTENESFHHIPLFPCPLGLWFWVQSEQTVTKRQKTNYEHQFITNRTWIQWFGLAETAIKYPRLPVCGETAWLWLMLAVFLQHNEEPYCALVCFETFIPSKRANNANRQIARF